jgi:hypothetical protein
LPPTETADSSNDQHAIKKEEEEEEEEKQGSHRHDRPTAEPTADH